MIPTGITTPMGPFASTASPMPRYIPSQANVGMPWLRIAAGRACWHVPQKWPPRRAATPATKDQRVKTMQAINSESGVAARANTVNIKADAIKQLARNAAEASVRSRPM